ncbi:hypothetical protein SARC_06566 [Sphaeroforma arctica JP610]|uniref:VWFC domain-containing protein n=1 Tax=Sphaeroforma arctica JP610 TaxID=667725 RepID=A0A0L0FX21_9EUKA|nr:hypothetical protein SARC_06566 [Sphaeroforma arctica JP610]KNC81086.1 hypothetical protein SARC_06566 [Sphaeroforma arctica JP610]|eukprot:XP_014154988.1 hypothetical protein SARC_06566 [Sphaeroforma arctica JP610]
MLVVSKSVSFLAVLVLAAVSTSVEASSGYRVLKSCEYKGVWTKHGEWYKGDNKECYCHSSKWTKCKDVYKPEAPIKCGKADVECDYGTKLRKHEKCCDGDYCEDWVPKCNEETCCEKKKNRPTRQMQEL